MCVYVCLRMCVPVWVRVSACVCVCLFWRVCGGGGEYVSACEGTCECGCVCVSACVCVYWRVCVRVWVRVCVVVSMEMWVRVCVVRVCECVDVWARVLTRA